MRSYRRKTGLLAAALVLLPGLARAEFTMTLDVSPQSSNLVKIENPSPARDFVQHAALYLRFIPVKGNRVFPVFIDTRNYLTCPDKDKRWKLNRVSRVSFDKPTGIAIYGFFFDRPECDNPTFRLESIVADS